jgi:hypothetical protein
LFVVRRRAEKIRVVVVVGAAAFLELKVGVGCPRLAVLVPVGKVRGSRFRVQGSGLRIQGSGLRVSVSGFRARV